MEDAKRYFKQAGPAQRLWLWLEKAVNDAALGAYNPFYYLGAVCIFFMWIILVSGLYLFLFYSISAKEAYPSVEALTHGQWYLGGVMRSLHRYASDGLVIAAILHTLRCCALDRYKHWRKVAWVSGVIIAWLIIIGGIIGYWMVWDKRAQLIAILSSRLIEAAPIFGLPLSLSFSRLETLTNNFFYIILFIHFTTLFVVFLLIMVHISRITKSIINPPKAVSYGIVLILLVLSFLKPAVSAPAADIKALPLDVPFDWFFMFIFPLLKNFSEHQVWFFTVGLTLAFAAVPWLTWGRGAVRNPAAKVTLSNCTGCELCVEDCPYQAIQMIKRTDGGTYDLEAVVMSNRCASCGICAGACDYNAINLPNISEDMVKDAIISHCKELDNKADKKVIAFLCAKGAGIEGASGGRIQGAEWARAIHLPCIGMLQPSMIALAFDKEADGVFVAGCRQGDCSYRTGDTWFAGRLAGLRPPVVRKSVDRSRIRAVWFSAVENEALRADLHAFYAGLKKKGGS